MQRQNFHLPLLIGGATTSKAHTAVKVDPNYSNDAVVYVTDASRAVGVVTTLLSKELKPEYTRKIREEYAEIRERIAARSVRTKRLTYEQALANKPDYDWSTYHAPKPNITGTQRLYDIDLSVLAEYIDWTPFFYLLEFGRQVPAYF